MMSIRDRKVTSKAKLSLRDKQVCDFRVTDYVAEAITKTYSEAENEKEINSFINDSWYLQKHFECLSN